MAVTNYVLGFFFCFLDSFTIDSRLTNAPLHINPRGQLDPREAEGGGGGEGMEPSFKKGQSFRSFFSSVSGKQIEMVHFLYRRISGQRPLHIFMLEKRVQVWCDFFTHPSL